MALPRFAALKVLQIQISAGKEDNGTIRHLVRGEKHPPTTSKGCFFQHLFCQIPFCSAVFGGRSGRLSVQGMDELMGKGEMTIKQ